MVSDKLWSVRTKKDHLKKASLQDVSKGLSIGIDRLEQTVQTPKNLHCLQPTNQFEMHQQEVNLDLLFKFKDQYGY